MPPHVPGTVQSIGVFVSLIELDRVPLRRALISVYDKTGLEDFARGLHEAGVALVSTGSTAATIAAAGVPATEATEATGGSGRHHRED